MSPRGPQSVAERPDVGAGRLRLTINVTIPPFLSATRLEHQLSEPVIYTEYQVVCIKCIGRIEFIITSVAVWTERGGNRDGTAAHYYHIGSRRVGASLSISNG